MKILLQDNSLNLRGTSIAVYDYAYFLKEHYNYDCVITYDESDPNNNDSVIKKFTEKFETIPFKKISEIDQIIDKQQIDIFYSIKGGHKDDRITDKVKSCIHAVFPCPVTEKHGDVYAYVSEWLSEHCSGGDLPFVPHMINLPDVEENLRDVLSIPNDVIVFGRYGGYDTFDIPFVYQSIFKALETNKNIYFLFCNTPAFCSHPRVKFINSTSSLHNKVRFINTCDALLHARHRGETFGLTILEFMSRNKPIFTYGQSREENHYKLLDSQGYIYNNAEELNNQILSFTPHQINYRQLPNFTPSSVIKQYHNIFLK